MRHSCDDRRPAGTQGECLADVGKGDDFFPRQVGDRLRDPRDLVESPGAQAAFPELRAPGARRPRGRAPVRRPPERAVRARGHAAGPRRRAVLPVSGQQVVGVGTADRHDQIETVEEGRRDPPAVAGPRDGATGTGTFVDASPQGQGFMAATRRKDAGKVTVPPLGSPE